MKKKEEFKPVIFDQIEQEVLADACGMARDAYCARAKFECKDCKRKLHCDILSELELRLKGL